MAIDLTRIFKTCYSIINATNGRNLSSQAKLTTNYWQRMRGLLGTQSLQEGHGLVIDHCYSVHTFGMTYAIDVAFITRNLLILHEIHSMKPCRISRLVMRSYAVIELPAGTLLRSDTSVGDQLRFEPHFPP